MKRKKRPYFRAGEKSVHPEAAVIADETGAIRLFGAAENGVFTDILTAGIVGGDFFLL